MNYNYYCAPYYTRAHVSLRNNYCTNTHRVSDRNRRILPIVIIIVFGERRGALRDLRPGMHINHMQIEYCETRKINDPIGNLY